MEIMMIIAGIIGLLFEFVLSFRRELAKLNHYLDAQRNRPMIIRYDREGM